MFFIRGWVLLLGFSSMMMASFLPANRPYQALHYKINLEIDPSLDPKDFQAELEFKFKATSPLSLVALDIDELKIEKVTLLKPQKKDLRFDTSKDKILEITLPKPLKAGEQGSLVIVYKGNIRDAHYGFFKVRDPDEPSRGPLLFTHFEPLGARAFFPCNDEPYDKATTEVHAIVPARYEVLSNGKRTQDRKIKKDSKDWREVVWLMEKPHPTYLVSLAIGPFAKVEDSKKRPEISVWVGETKADKAHYAATVTRKSLEFFEGYLGVKYPWNKYATVGLPTFLWGGMENTSSTHMNQERTLLNDPSSEFEKKSIVGLAAHELAHQWFGDFVTMKWWDDVWLNESFASLMGTLATKHIFENEEADIELVVDTWDSYFREEDGPRSHPIVDKGLTSPDDAFDATNYTKGENVLRTLSFYVGEEKFKKGLQKYLKAHAFGNATYTDFFKAVEEASGERLDAFRDSWLLQRGYPVLSYGGNWNKEKSSFKFRMTQASNHAEDKTTFVFRVPVVFHRKSTPSYSKEVLVKMDGKNFEQTVSLLAEPEWISVNPRGVVLARVKQEVNDEAALVAQALSDPESIARVWASYELARGLIDGGTVSSLAEKTLLNVLKSDVSPYVRISILHGLQRMKTRWLPPLLRDGVFDLATLASNTSTKRNILSLSDSHGWAEYRSELLGTLGKVDKAEALNYLQTILQNPILPLDDLQRSSFAVAAIGDARSTTILKEALKIHQDRGYRYKFSLQIAFGAYESPNAANEIREMAGMCGSDLMGRLGRVVTKNQTLKNSPEWAQFLRDFILHNDRFGDEVKARILHTIEEVKTSQVQTMLESVVKESPSLRMREACKKILDKNFKS